MRIATIAIFVVFLGLALTIWATRPSAGSDQIVLPSKTPFTKGRFFAFAMPWAGETVTILKPWAPHADAVVLNLSEFPNKSVVHWRWPPLVPHFGLGVWGYNAVMYGNYDGGVPEKPVAPIRVRDLKELRQSYSFRLSNRFGDGNVLTEFYLRSSTTNVHAKVIEIGWFFHMPPNTRAYFDSATPVGRYVDEQGRRWMVRIGEKFCMIAPEQPQDLPMTGTLDMLPVLRWLQQKGRISGNEWMSGIALGVEPVSGIGTMSIDRWPVTMR
ncbi:hypothetical protein [Sphingomonas radiodurans]|uniref:hypothetical protein n=1 Tax=Sphingomonas radiodurans TaxID=2890321 RepID=UPI001E4A59B6|nr:hypothetical protein [Sphingomonas radiodurans]WBH15335.1 hypothetical protein LLW23_10815 [Sphingomonas radiodurans]